MSTTDRTQMQDVLAAIREMDATDLAIVAETVHQLRGVQRSHERRELSAATGGLRVGDRARFNGRAHPRYLVGTEFTVTKINDKSVGIVLDADADPRALRRFGTG